MESLFPGRKPMLETPRTPMQAATEVLLDLERDLADVDAPTPSNMDQVADLFGIAAAARATYLCGEMREALDGDSPDLVASGMRAIVEVAFTGLLMYSENRVQHVGSLCGDDVKRVLTVAKKVGRLDAAQRRHEGIDVADFSTRLDLASVAELLDREGLMRQLSAVEIYDTYYRGLSHLVEHATLSSLMRHIAMSGAGVSVQPAPQPVLDSQESFTTAVTLTVRLAEQSGVFAFA
jgi:hypothetical protein